MFWNRPHKHYWVATNSNVVGRDGERAMAEIVTYQCFRCGSLRYDKVDGSGLVSSVVTNDKGEVMKSEPLKTAKETDR